MLLDLMEIGLKAGHSPEAALAEVASSRDRSLGARFHLLAAHLEQGLRLSEAIAAVPRLLSPQISAMLKAGERIGDVSKVLPACRLLLRDSVSQVRGALNYLLLAAFVMTPFSIFVLLCLRIKVLPSFEAVFAGMFEGASLPALTRFVFDSSSVFVVLQIAFLLFIWLATLAYLGGPRLRGWLGGAVPGTLDRWLYALPWRRKRLQRDFSAMLAALLDAETPEAEAVRLAGDSTANAEMRRRAEHVAAQLQQGVKLSEGIRLMDDSPEFQWRLANAMHRAGGFVRALSGWQEALDARAFQLEQTAAQIATTLLVLANGLITGCIVIGMFIALIQLIDIALLW
jgi:type II secretory pathway component PulF